MFQEYAAPPVGAQTQPAHVHAHAMAEHGLPARLGAELFGTFFLVLAILGVALYTIGGIGPGTLGVALAGGIALFAAISAFGHVSGGHFNPAVSLGAAIAGRMSWIDVVPYWIAQFVGGAIAAGILYVTIPAKALSPLVDSNIIKSASRGALMATAANGFADHSPLSATTNNIIEFSMWTAVLVETVLAAVLVAVILGVTNRRDGDRVAPMAIGLTLSVVMLIAAPFTGSALNPARAIAAAIFANEGVVWKQQWVFGVAPLVGAAVSALFYRAFVVAPEQDLLLGEEIEVRTDEDEDAAQSMANPYARPVPDAVSADAPIVAEPATAAPDTAVRGAAADAALQEPAASSDKTL